MDPQEPKYMFRPIAEDVATDPMPNSVPASSSALDHILASSSAGLTNIRPQMTMSPTRPKLYSCWRRSEENWSSTGSRHSSRPGSSTASSSRPPSQPNVVPQNPCSTQNPVQQVSSANCNSGLYCKSNNSSTSDVSVARNFQQLSVSSRRALFKTQKWSHSFDQANLSMQAQMSPGRKRQALGHQNKSLDMDSGYSGSWAMDQYQAVGMTTTLPNIDLSESSSWMDQPTELPSFPQSFKPEVSQINAASNDEPLEPDDLDEEIKMIVARAEHREGLLSFLEEQDLGNQCEDPLVFDGGGGNVLDADDRAPDLKNCEDLLYVRPEPVRTRNPLLCQKSSSSSGYETCISSVSDNISSIGPEASIRQPLAPPRTKRRLAKMAEGKDSHRGSPNQSVAALAGKTSIKSLQQCP